MPHAYKMRPNPRRRLLCSTPLSDSDTHPFDVPKLQTIKNLSHDAARLYENFIQTCQAYGYPQLEAHAQNSEDSDLDTSIASRSFIEITSGPARTHSTLLHATATVYGPRITHKDVFLCKDAVDLCKLLYLSRRTLYDVGKGNGANVLLDEQ